MITTSGFKVDPSAMPRYQPVDPKLMSFNPQNVTGGALESINVMSQLDQLKSFREHEAEWAKLADIRNKKAKAEADLAAISAEVEGRTKEGLIASKGATYAATSRVAPAEAAFKTDKFDADRSMIPKGLTLSNLVVDSQIEDSRFAERQREQIQTAKEYANATAVTAAKADLTASPHVASAKVMAARKLALETETAYNTTLHKWINNSNDLKLSDELVELEVKHKKALVAKTNAEAAELAERHKADEIRRVQVDAQINHQNNVLLSRQLREAEISLKELGAVKVSNPQRPNESIEVSRLFPLAFERNKKTGEWVPRTNWLRTILGRNRDLDVATEAAFDRWTAQAGRVDGLMKEVDATKQIAGKHALAMKKALGEATQAPAVGETKIVTQKDKVTQKEAQYKIQWDGTKWVEVK